MQIKETDVITGTIQKDNMTLEVCRLLSNIFVKIVVDTKNRIEYPLKIPVQIGNIKTYRLSST